MLLSPSLRRFSPIDLILGVKEEVDKEAGSYHTFVRQLRNRLSQAYKVAASYIQKQQDSQRSGLDRQHLLTNASIEEGDRVLVRQIGSGPSQAG